jgi:cell wall-associated NlpC family hydrolase
MVAPSWCKPFTNLLYEDKGRGPVGFDCWGFVRQVVRERFGLELPDLSDEYPSAEDHDAVAAVAERNKRLLAMEWPQVSSAREGDVVILRVAGRPWHCGICVGGDWMMHITKDVNVGLERFTNPVWRNRIEGFYRHV